MEGSRTAPQLRSRSRKRIGGIKGGRKWATISTNGDFIGVTRLSSHFLDDWNGNDLAATRCRIYEPKLYCRCVKIGADRISCDAVSYSARIRGNVRNCRCQQQLLRLFGRVER